MNSTFNLDIFPKPRLKYLSYTDVYTKTGSPWTDSSSSGNRGRNEYLGSLMKYCWIIQRIVVACPIDHVDKFVFEEKSPWRHHVTISRREREGKRKKKKRGRFGKIRESGGSVVSQYPFKPEESSSLERERVVQGTTKEVVCERFRWRVPPPWVYVRFLLISAASETKVSLFRFCFFLFFFPFPPAYVPP